MKVAAKDFHPMRGHVEDGAIVLFSDGSSLMLRSSMVGWRLVNGKGETVIHEVRDAGELTRLIVEREESHG